MYVPLFIYKVLTRYMFLNSLSKKPQFALAINVNEMFNKLKQMFCFVLIFHYTYFQQLFETRLDSYQYAIREVLKKDGPLVSYPFECLSNAKG